MWLCFRVKACCNLKAAYEGVPAWGGRDADSHGRLLRGTEGNRQVYGFAVGAPPSGSGFSDRR